MITATRGLKKRKFDDHVWKEMPSHKYGWTLAADEPEEILQLKERVVTKKDVMNNPDLKGLEGKTVGMPVTPQIAAQSPISPEDEIAKIKQELNAPGLHHMVRKKLEKRLAELTEEQKPVVKEESDNDSQSEPVTEPENNSETSTEENADSNKQKDESQLPGQ